MTTTDDRTPALEVRSARKVYRRGHTEVVALDEVSLCVRTGEFVAIMGPSGSGKSTLMHLLGALDTPTEGDVLVRGRPLRGSNRRELARIRTDEIGFVFQAFNLIPGLTALDNVALPARLAGRGRTARTHAAELLDQVGLGDAHDATPSELSGGQQQRVAVARALIMDPSVVLADEPTGNLDSAAGADVLALLESTKRTLVLVTHDPRIAARADRIISLRDGKVVDELDTTPLDHQPRGSRRRPLISTEP